VFAVLEDVLPPIFAKYGTYNTASAAPFKRIPYLESMDRYGSDKPDLRIDLTVTDISDLVVDSEFEPFNGKVVKAVPVSGCKLTRKQIDKLCADVEVQAGRKPYWLRMDENGAFAGGVTKFFGLEFTFLKWPGIGDLLRAVCKLQTLAVLALPLILIPTRTKLRLPKWLGYAIYPLHLVLLIILRVLLKGATWETLTAYFR
jgi:hypothetical protein